MAFRNFSKISPWALAAGTAALLAAPSADACGGLFCSNSNPVNQVAERIIFAQNPDETVTATIEILYEGPAHEFAWVLPVAPGDIEVGVSSKQAFDALQAASNPTYQLNTTFDCDNLANAGGGPVFASAPQDGAAEPEGVAPDVEVLAAGTAGPYEWQHITVNPELDDRADVAVEWLEENGYDVSALGPDTLRPYLDQDMNLVAVKLSKSADSGSIRPMMVTYPGTQPSIPIIPTAVAASDDMGVMVWTLGPSRAVPLNYLDLQLNEALINWFNPGPSYNDVIIAAALEAGGQGFVTEQAGDAAVFSESIYPTWKKDQWEDSVRSGSFASIEAFFETVQAVMTAPGVNSFGGFGGPLGQISSAQSYYDGFAHVMGMADVVPLREGATPEQFMSCISCYFEEDVAVQTDIYPSTPFVPGEDPLLDIDVVKFMDAVEEYVLDPLQATQDLFDRNEKITRFYTTLSPEDMTLDPVFGFNADLEDYSNVHVADRVMMCEPEGDIEWTVELPQGMRIEGIGQTWPITLESEMKVNLLVRQMGTEGNGMIIDNNAESIATDIVAQGAGEAGDLLTRVEEEVEASDPFMAPEDPKEEDPKEEDPSTDVDEETMDTNLPTAPDDVEEVADDDKRPGSGEGDESPSITDEDTMLDSEDKGLEMTDVVDSSGDNSASSGGCSVTASGKSGGVPAQSAWGLLLGAALLLRRRKQNLES